MLGFHHNPQELNELLTHGGNQHHHDIMNGVQRDERVLMQIDNEV